MGEEVRVLALYPYAICVIVLCQNIVLIINVLSKMQSK